MHAKIGYDRLANMFGLTTRQSFGIGRTRKRTDVCSSGNIWDLRVGPRLKVVFQDSSDELRCRLDSYWNGFEYLEEGNGWNAASFVAHEPEEYLHVLSTSIHKHAPQYATARRELSHADQDAFCKRWREQGATLNTCIYPNPYYGVQY